MSRYFIIVLILTLTRPLFSQINNANSSEIYLGIHRLATLGNAMYIAAHPDDENTLMITWLSKEKHVRTAYFAMTRGDGGQNLIGSEQGEAVGLLRTHELLEARKVDGGEQYFSRAIDFGYSKTTEETLKFWDKEKVLGDLVYRIRKFKPDIIINRFPPDQRAGHGHHSASAVLSIEAFDLAADPSAYPEQLAEVGVWQAKRLFWNTFGGGFSNPQPENNDFLKISLGDYNQLLGESYTELAARARSKHRSQGFGSAPTRGERFDYLIPLKGEPALNDPFEGIDLTWNRVKGGKPIAKLLKRVIKKYDFRNPSASLTDLLKVYTLIKQLPESVYKEEKLRECAQLISDCTGLYIESYAEVSHVSPGQELPLVLSATKRSDTPVVLKEWKIVGEARKDTLVNMNLTLNQPVSIKTKIKIPGDAAITQPYWLKEESEIGTYVFSEDQFRNLAMAPDPLRAEMSVNIDGVDVIFTQAVKYKYTEPSRGEIYKYVEIRPDVSLNFDQKVYVSANKEKVSVAVQVKNNVEENKVKVKLNLPAGWSSNPTFHSLDFSVSEDKTVVFEVTPDKLGGRVKITAEANTVYGESGYSFNQISYEHVPELNTFPIAEAMVIVPELEKRGKEIGYIMGAGDDVPQSLNQIGYNITFLSENDLQGDLTKYDAVIVGVRAYNTKDWLLNLHSILMEYVYHGGTLITQYQTNAFFGVLKIDQLGPYPITINRGRVTEEDSEVKFINPDDPVLNYPNKITSADFENWVQERGLYFASKWSDDYSTVLSMHDTGEDPLEGALLYTKYGNGYFVFTGLSFFRQLPAGVPGAFRLMANLISLGK